MNLRVKFFSSTGLLCLLCLMLPGSLRADPVPSLLAGTPVNMNFTTDVGWMEWTYAGGMEEFTSATGTLLYYVSFTTPPLVSYIFTPEDCTGTYGPPGYCGIYDATFGPGGSIEIDGWAPRVEFTGSFTSGTGSGEVNEVWAANFGGTFTLKGIDGSGTLSAWQGIPYMYMGGTMDYSGVVTPEPSSLILMLIGIGFVAVILKRIA